MNMNMKNVQMRRARVFFALVILLSLSGRLVGAETESAPVPPVSVSAPAPAPKATELPEKAKVSPPVQEAVLDLEWEVVEDAISYELKLIPVAAGDSGGGESDRNGGGGSGGSGHSHSGAGGEPIVMNVSEPKISRRVPVGVYKVQIRSKDKATGYFGPWSAPIDVEVSTKVVELLEPANGSEIPAPNEKHLVVPFRWRPTPGARRYALRIWSDDIEKAKEFQTSEASFELKLATGRLYYWQVTFENERGTGYRAMPGTYSFMLLGPQLVQPVVNRKLPFPLVNKIAWSKIPRAEFYRAKLFHRHLDESEWREFLLNEKLESPVWNLDRLKPGAYRIEVSAHARNRVSSEVGSYEFIVKPPEKELSADVSTARNEL